MSRLKIKKPKSVLIFPIAIFIILFLSACGDTQVNLRDEETTQPNFVPQMDPKEREEIITNPIFAAVVEGQSIEEIDKVISTSGVSLLALNKRGDTPLGTAIQLKLKEKAFHLLGKIQCDGLSHQNKKGESYIYLAAKHGYEELIHSIAEKCYENDFFDGSNYEFSNLDPETKTGETAIHTALNGSVAGALDYEYNRGALEYSWWVFHKLNKRKESFLHTAVKDSRINTVEWAVRSYCHEGDWEKSSNSWKSIPASLFQKFWNGLQAFTWNIDQLINYQDIEGNTSLHISALALNEQSIRLLSSCRWMDFLIENKDGNIALQVFLLALDPSLRNHTQNIKDTFVFLTHKETSLKKWFTNISSTVDHQNKKGQSALHISARLADPFFYNYLKQFADLYLKNNSNETAKPIFEATQRRINRL